MIEETKIVLEPGIHIHLVGVDMHGLLDDVAHGQPGIERAVRVLEDQRDISANLF